MQKPEFQFRGKYLIEADLRLTTALHIGGTEEGLEIGGMDNPVIKDPMTGIPFIPGSSLKGKMRSLLEWAHGLVIPEEEKKDAWIAGPAKDPKSDVCIVFGIAAEAHKGEKLPGPTRLIVEDAYPKNSTDEYDQKAEWEKYMGEGIFTEIKTENTIDRLTSAATNPRPVERVPVNSIFKTRFIFDVYEEADFYRLKVLFEGMTLLEDSTLGGGGSRGSGRVKFENINIEARHKGYYLGTEEKGLRDVNKKIEEWKSARDFVADFDQILIRNDIDSLVEKIVDGYKPEKILLFGSYVRGNFGPDSDLDVMIIKESDDRPVVRRRKVLHLLRGTKMPKDIFVNTPREFEDTKDVIGTIAYEAYRSGKVVYG